MNYNIVINNNKSRIGFFTSEIEKKNIINYLVPYYNEKNFKIYNYNSCLDKNLYNNINITEYIKLKKKEIIFAKINRPLDYLLFNKNIKSKDNLVSFLKGPNFYLPTNFYDYLIFETGLKYNKIKIQKVYKNLNEDKTKFNEWWSKINKKWLIIDTKSQLYFQTNDILEIFNKKTNTNCKYSFSDYLFDI
jgi:hypothetical protein